MRRRPFFVFVGICVALSLPMSAAGLWHSRVQDRDVVSLASTLSSAPRLAQNAAAVSHGTDPTACGEVPDYISPRYFWYMTTVLSLDCIADIANDHLKTSTPHADAGADEDTLVAVSRDELQRIVTLAREAKHAAVLIN